MNANFRHLYAQLYDQSVSDWPHEIDFYRDLAAQAQGEAIVEVACGTGRVAIPLAEGGARVTGLDLNPAMLDIARKKSRGRVNMRWVEGDMRSFALGESFGLALIPGHAFQNLNTPDDQLDCLACIRRHLVPGGLLVVHLDHQDVGWLGEIGADKAGVYETGSEVTDTQTGNRYRESYAWAYERSSQTATLWHVWEQVDSEGMVIRRTESGPIPLHCFFRYEMEHLAYRAGFVVEALYGDFLRQPLQDDSSDMIWLLRKP
ncbi:MAG: class I SAM-dependent methyltransferase [Anaerolineae bacterium]|nr:class I SAM-dependent methyltransferase [Anaerolineae bacterium]